MNSSLPSFIVIPWAEFMPAWSACCLTPFMGLAVLAQLPPGSAFSTLEVKVHFVRPIAVKTGTLVAEGKVVHPGSRIATAEARLVDRQGKLYAHGTATCIVLPETS